MTNTTIDLDEESKTTERSGEGSSLLGVAEGGDQIKVDCQRFGIDSRKFDIDYLIENCPFKTYRPDEMVDWSRMRIYSVLQMPTHPSYENMYQEVKKFMPMILQRQIQQEKFRRGEVDPQMLQMMKNTMGVRTPGGQNLVIQRHNQQPVQQ